ncbi:MAG: hypothetical protein HKN09_03295, partial [Saprospiraceae bacterium]|nr:hypothetical protein [Saprospiraceae bacterium]
QLHHPHKSELWTPGESDFTGEVISRLEQFSSACNKPSLHLFGHTHGYSRGQSRDHKHLWINVATAGGAIDNWGEFPNFDYDEFSVSQDEYGFVILEATNDEEPVLNIKRISRGDQDNIEDNIITDIITLSPKQENINSPSPLAPLNETLPPECVTLKASPFDGMHGEHGQSHWQVDVENSDFSNPIFESWKNFENWYFDVDTQAEDDLSDEVATALNPNTRYKWRVRYRDKAFNWSPWSEAASFETGPSIALPNLLSNPGAEYGLSDWTILEGVVEALPKDTCDGVAPFEGEYYFIVGGLCDHSSVARLIQEVEVTHFQDSIDGGDFRISFGGYLSNYGGLDQPEMKLIFLDADSNSLGESNSLTTLNNRWTPVEDQMSVPIGTRRIQLELMGTRNGGTDNDSYFDDLYLTLGREIIDCSTLTADHELKPDLAAGKIIPNPNSGTFEIELPFEFDNSMQLFMMNSNGQKVQSDMTAEGKSLKIRSHNLTNGQYYLWITQNNVMRLYNKVVITP